VLTDFLRKNRQRDSPDLLNIATHEPTASAKTPTASKMEVHNATFCWVTSNDSLRFGHAATDRARTCFSMTHLLVFEVVFIGDNH